jgi:DNA-binding beta-propeller fold protein YncE
MRVLLIACLLVASACSPAGDGPTLRAGPGEDAGSPPSDAASHETVTPDGDRCLPECIGKECGGDGCGGLCGECSDGLECDDEGVCQEVLCTSSKDCPGALVCWGDGGICVICVGDEDCPPGQECGKDHNCHELFDCVSDKDCKTHSMVCDKEAGICVACLQDTDCQPNEYCDESYCLADSCAAGTRQCVGLTVEECAANGSAMNVAEQCDPAQYCELGECLDYVCAAGSKWCEGGEAIWCAEDGKSIAAESDCSEMDMFCFEGDCLDTVCQPGATVCVDGSAKGLCAGDGSALSEEACLAQHYCLEGSCHPWLCEPDVAVCDGGVARTCNELGNDWAEEIDCVAQEQTCVDGECTDYVCAPESIGCFDPSTQKVCALDGMSFEKIPCSDGFCDAGSCLPWICQPNLELCQGDVVVKCDGWGSGFLPDGTDCAALGGCCLEGACAIGLEEVCDGLDNDCDGQVDEGVLSPCGNCDPKCNEAVAGEGGEAPFEPEPGLSYGVLVNEDGQLTSEAQTGMPPHLWVANSGEQTVSKIDTESLEEVGRYKVCGSPSRTAVDLEGNVYVGCRSDGGVAKIHGDIADCEDKNGDGIINTSTDSYIYGGVDECVAYQVYPGGSCARALGVDGKGYPWVGDWSAQTVKKLDPLDGSMLQSISLGCSPYGLVVDADGIIWISGRGCNQLVRVDPETNQVKKLNPPSGNLYGVTVDLAGRIWMGHYSNHAVSMYEPETGGWHYITSGIGSGCPRGMAASIDGYVYSGLGCSGTQIARINGDTLAVNLINVSPGTTPIGVALDATGGVWAACYSSSSVVRIDAESQKLTASIAVGKNPYTYSDMTGYILHNITLPDLNPYYVHKFAGGGGVVDWQSLSIEAASNGQCDTMSVLVRPGVEEPDGKQWQEVGADIPIADVELPIAGIAAPTDVLEVRLELPYQAEGCLFHVKSLAAIYQE